MREREGVADCENSVMYASRNWQEYSKYVQFAYNWTSCSGVSRPRSTKPQTHPRRFLQPTQMEKNKEMCSDYKPKLSVEKEFACKNKQENEQPKPFSCEKFLESTKAIRMKKKPKQKRPKAL